MALTLILKGILKPFWGMETHNTFHSKCFEWDGTSLEIKIVACYKFSFKNFKLKKMKLIFKNGLSVGLTFRIRDERIICGSLYIAKSFSTVDSISLLNIESSRKDMCLRRCRAHLIIL